MSTKPHYTLEELSEITSLTVRTLRNYMHRGLLQGEKENGKWYFYEKNLTEFFSSTFVQQGMKMKHQTVVGDFLHGPVKNASCGCFLYDLPGTQEELLQLCKKVTELLNQREHDKADALPKKTQFSFYYDGKKKVGSFALSGDLKLIGQIVALLQE